MYTIGASEAFFVHVAVEEQKMSLLSNNTRNVLFFSLLAKLRYGEKQVAS